MGNVVNVSGATELNMYLANNTAAYLAANLELLKVALETDSLKLGYTDHLGGYHTVGDASISGTPGYFSLFDTAGTNLDDSPLDYNITNAGKVTSMKPMSILGSTINGTGYATIDLDESQADYHHYSSRLNVRSDKTVAYLELAVKDLTRYIANVNGSHQWYVLDTAHSASMALSKGVNGDMDGALCIGSDAGGAAYSHLDIMKSSTDYTNWHQLYRQSGLNHGLTDLFPTTDTAFGILVNNLAAMSNSGNQVILRATGTDNSGSPSNTLKIESISPTWYSPAVVLDGSIANGTGRTAMGATGHLLDISNNGSVVASFLGNGYTGIGTTSPVNKLSVSSSTNAPDSYPTSLGSVSGRFSILNNNEYGLLVGVAGSGNSFMQAQRVDGESAAYNLILQPIGGYVGIGTTNPSIAKLQIETTGSQCLYARVTCTSGTVYGVNVDAIGAATNNIAGYFNASGATNNYGLIVHAGLVGIGTDTPSSHLDIMKSSTDYTNWHQLYRQSGLAHGLTDLFPTTDTAFGILINHPAPETNGGTTVILRAAGGAEYSNSRILTIDSIAPDDLSPAITLDGSKKYYNGRQSMGASGSVLVVSSNGNDLIKVTGNGVFFPKQEPTVSAPAYAKGGIYFDTTLNKLRVGGATAWETVTSI